MSPKRRESPERTKTSKATTRPDRLIELAECLDTLLSLDLVFYTPFVVGEPEPDSPAGLKYCEESRLFKLKVEQAEKELVQLKQKTMATLQDSLAFVEEGEAVVIMSVVDRFNICVRRFYEAHSGPLYSDEFEAYRDRLNELAARLRVRAAKMRAPVHAATPETQAGETRRTVLFQDNFEKVCILTPTGRRGVKADLRPSPLTILLKRLFTEWEKNPETRLEWTGALQKEIGYGEQVEPGKDARPSRRWRDPNKKTPGRTKILNKIIEDTRDDISGPWKVRLNPRFKYTVKHP